ncbi:triphosphoribosyl-dephospho-CoA synthase [Mycobacterium sp. 050134]|uniref:triphosphoribosyl-dephospho-CoA synthase n=1 Tax=Mycobacterium sp. 050134 TaxID=3096111 RepID=UPI002EDA8A46
MTAIGNPGDLVHVTSTPLSLAGGAVAALIDEAALAPKPGLVDPRAMSAHDDMDMDTLNASARALGPIFAELAEMAQARAPDLRLRADVGAAGRRGEQQMLAATRGVNTHRGALWALGLLICGAVNADGADGITEYGAELARLPDPMLTAPREHSHGAVAERRYHVSGARGEAQSGFPHVRLALNVLRDARMAGLAPVQARLQALIELIARLDDTCLLYRGGIAGLTAMQQAARAVLAEGGPNTPRGARALAKMDRQARRGRLSPGGSGDLLAAAMFLDELTRL